MVTTTPTARQQQQQQLFTTGNLKPQLGGSQLQGFGGTTFCAKARLARFNNVMLGYISIC